jgi:hypothetical protein
LSDFNNCWIFTTDLRKQLQICLIGSQQVAKDLIHADTRTMFKARFPSYLFDFKETWNSYRNFKKSTKFHCNLFSAEGQTERAANIKNRNLQFWYAITNALHIYRRPAKFLAFLQTVQSITHCCLSGQHGYTRGPLEDTNVLKWEYPNFKLQANFNYAETHYDFAWLLFFTKSLTLHSWHFKFNIR